MMVKMLSAEFGTKPDKELLEALAQDLDELNGYSIVEKRIDTVERGETERMSKS